MRWLPALLILCMLTGAKPSFAQDEIRMLDTPAPDASTFGIDSPRFPHVSFAGSSAPAITALLQSIPIPLGPGVGQDMLIALMMMPVYPDSVAAFPADWFTYRVDRLIRQGAYADALRLVDRLPDSLHNETTTRRYVDLALTIGDVDAACAQTQASLKDNTTQVDSYWSLRQAFCQHFEKQPEAAELTLAIFSEQYPAQEALGYRLLAGWGNAQATLPPLTMADIASVPLLIASLEHAKSSRAGARLPSDFVPIKEMNGLTPALAVALAKREKLPLPVRLQLASQSAASGAADAAFLRGLLEKVTPGDAVEVQFRPMAALIADLNAAQSIENKLSATYHALATFKRYYTPYTARGILGKELEAFSQNPEGLPVTPELALELAAFHIERGNSSRVKEIRRFLERRASQDQAFAMVLATVNAALYHNRQLGGEQSEAVAVPEFTTAQRPEIMWALRRLVVIQQAMGDTLPIATASLSRTAPLADTASPNAADMLALEEAQQQGRSGEVVLRCIALTEEGRLAFVADDVLARCVSALMQTGQPTYAAALAQAALLNPPIAPLQASSGTLAGTRR